VGAQYQVIKGDVSIPKKGLVVVWNMLAEAAHENVKQ